MAKVNPKSKNAQLALNLEVGKKVERVTGANKNPSKAELKAAADAAAAAGRVNRRLAAAAKAAAYKFETSNERHLYLYMATGGWWKLGGRSALIYYYRLSPRIAGLRRPKLLNDSDFNCYFKDGVIAIKDVERLRKNLDSIGVKLVEQAETYQLFDLGYKLSDAELKKLQKLERERKERVNQIVMPKDLYPDIYYHIMEVQKMVRAMAYKMDGLDQRLYGRPLLEQVQQMSVEYKTLANGEIELKIGLEALRKGSQQVLYRLHDILELGIEAQEKRMELVRLASELKRLIMAEQKKCAQKI